MSVVDCHACGAKSDALLCRDCTGLLEQALAEMPARLRDLEITATRQANVGDVPQRAPAVIAEYVLADTEERAVPARLRSHHGRITLPATALPYAPGAAELHRQAVAGIRSWAIAAGVTTANGDHARNELHVVRNRMLLRAVYLNPAPADLCTRLTAAVERLRLGRLGLDIHTKVLDLVATIEATIDRRAPEVFAGLCTATDVRVLAVPWIGPPCGLSCEHETCEAIREGRHLLAPTVAECGQELRGVKDEASVECEACGTVWDVAERREWMADQMADRLGTVREVADFLRSLELDVTVDKVDGWLRRGRVVDHGAAPDGRRLVRFGEVRTYAERLAARASARRNVVAA